MMWQQEVRNKNNHSKWNRRKWVVTLRHCCVWQMDFITDNFSFSFSLSTFLLTLPTENPKIFSMWYSKRNWPQKSTTSQKDRCVEIFQTKLNKYESRDNIVGNFGNRKFSSTSFSSADDIFRTFFFRLSVFRSVAVRFHDECAHH